MTEQNQITLEISGGALSDIITKLREVATIIGFSDDGILFTIETEDDGYEAGRMAAELQNEITAIDWCTICRVADK